MKIAVIADDLTGAGDTGIQLGKKGMAVSVLLDIRQTASAAADAVVFDTDSRSVPKTEAYRRVQAVCSWIRQLQEIDLVYKKIDSTFRGNIGTEMDSVYDAFQPDFVVLAPSYPRFGRIVKNGQLFVHGIPLHETDTAKDPKNPVTLSSIPELVRQQTARRLAAIPLAALRGDREQMSRMLKLYKEEGTAYLLFDAENETDLKTIVSIFRREEYKVVWSGSAGLADALSGQWNSGSQGKNDVLSPAGGRVLTVVGSVSTCSRIQLERVLRRPDVHGIKMCSNLILKDEERRKEMERIAGIAEAIPLSEQKHIVLYSSGSPHEVREAVDTGARLGMNAGEVSSSVSRALGEAAARIIAAQRLRNLVLTGGDTARQVLLQLGASEIELIDEVEPGIPVGRLSGEDSCFVITKAGGFGNDDSLNNAIDILKAERL
ncbi:four-carbon acid sugar kinase family protein [Paenibacillus tarimensis]